MIVTHLSLCTGKACPGHVPFSASRGSHAMMQLSLGFGLPPTLSISSFLTFYKELVSCSVHGIHLSLDTCPRGNS